MLADAKDIFADMDLNGDGVLSIEEVKQFLMNNQSDKKLSKFRENQIDDRRRKMKGLYDAQTSWVKQPHSHKLRAMCKPDLAAKAAAARSASRRAPLRTQLYRSIATRPKTTGMSSTYPPPKKKNTYSHYG